MTTSWTRVLRGAIALSLAAAVAAARQAQAEGAKVWRVDSSYSGQSDTPPNPIIASSYVEPAAAAADAAFGPSGGTDYWNTWDMDTRSGVLGGWAWFNGVLTADADSAHSTLWSTDGGTPVTIGSTANNGQHQPWYGTGTGTPFAILTGQSTSSGVNGNDPASTYSFVISGLTPGKTFLFYGYALNNGDSRGDILAGYGVSLDGGPVTTVNRSAYTEGDAASGKLLSTIVGGSGSVTITLTAAGLTGPGFQFAETDSGDTTTTTTIEGTTTTTLDTTTTVDTTTTTTTSVPFVPNTAKVWRVDSSYSGQSDTLPSGGGWGVMIGSYVEPAAAAADAAFGSSGGTDYWNTWDMDTRSGVLGGWAWFNGVLTADNDAAHSTLWSTDGGSSVTIGSTANNGQHQPWYSNGTGTFFAILTGQSTSSGVNGNDPASTYSFVISGLTPGKTFLFYDYALHNGDARGDILAGYGVSLDGGPVTTVNRSAYAEGDAASGKLLSTIVGGSGSVTITLTAAGLTGPGFQFAETDSGDTTTTTTIEGTTTTTLDTTTTVDTTTTTTVNTTTTTTTTSPFVPNDAKVWRVDSSYSGQSDTLPSGGGYGVMIGSYVEPAAAAADAAFGSSGGTNYWNTWDMDTRSGVLGGWAWFNGVLTADNDSAHSTLWSTDGGTPVTIGSTANNGQHQPWYGNGTGTPFAILTGQSTSSGVNGNDPASTYSFVISGLTPGKTFLFYGYALNNGDARGDILAGYGVSLDGGPVTTVNRSAYTEGDAASGKLLSTVIGESGNVTITLTAAGLTGPGFQFAEAPAPLLDGNMLLIH